MEERRGWYPTFSRGKLQVGWLVPAKTEVGLALFCLFISVLQVQFGKEPYEYLMTIWRWVRKKKPLSRFLISSIFQVCCGRWYAADNECSPEWRRNLHMHRSNQPRRDERHCPAYRTGWDGFGNNKEASVMRYDTKLNLNSPRTAGMPCVCCCRCSRCPPESRNIWHQESQEHQPLMGAGQRSQQLGYR